MPEVIEDVKESLDETLEYRLKSLQNEINNMVSTTVTEVERLIADLSRQIGSEENTNLWEEFKEKRYAIVTGTLSDNEEIESFKNLREKVRRFTSIKTNFNRKNRQL